MLDLKLMPRTEPGARFVALMERHAAEFAPRAAELDKSGRFVADNIRALCESGAMGAAVPAELGGLGVSSLHDLAVGSSRLARGDASTAIASWMHLAATSMMAGAHRAIRAKGGDGGALASTLRGVIEERQVIAVLGTEPGAYMGYFQTRATPTDDGFLIDGLKIFGTLAQSATLLNVAVQVDAPDGKRHIGFALVPSDAAGVRINDDWDAMGMRASGSGSVLFEQVAIPRAALAISGEYGVEAAAGLYTMAGRNAGLVATAIGIAEAARAEALSGAGGKRKAPSGRAAAERHAIQQLAGEVDVLLNAVHATFAQDCLRLEELQARHSPRSVPLDEMRAIEAAVRATKLFVERSCVEIVDKCLAISGGGGFLGKSPLSRHYRDVRALPFMAPQATESLQYIGMVALGLAPELDL